MTEFETVSCCECAIEFQVTEIMFQRRAGDGKDLQLKTYCAAASHLPTCMWQVDKPCDCGLEQIQDWDKALK